MYLIYVNKTKVFLGVKKGWATLRLVLFRGIIQHFRQASLPLSYGSSHGMLHPYTEDCSQAHVSCMVATETWINCNYC